MKLLIAFLFSVNAMAAFTPFPPSSPPADSITAKGNLLTSNGTDQAEFTACADGEILEWAADLSACIVAIGLIIVFIFSRFLPPTR